MAKSVGFFFFSKLIIRYYVVTEQLLALNFSSFGYSRPLRGSYIICNKTAIINA